MFGAIEAGGTKFVCAVGSADARIIERVEFPTTIPEETMELVITFFNKYKEQITAIGVGTFGPADVSPNSEKYGSITSTPKPGWKNYPILQELKKHFDVPIGFNTDVNVAALGEQALGAAKGNSSCLYITVGTGIGAGAVISGSLLQGHSHPEMGHILVRRHPDDNYLGKCPYHADCLEGLAAGPAIEGRWGKKGIELVDQAEVWELEGYYLAQALIQYILILSPEKIVLGGGVMKQKQVFDHIYKYLPELIGGYVELPELSSYIVSPSLGDNAGITGALILAINTLNDMKQMNK